MIGRPATDRRGPCTMPRRIASRSTNAVRRTAPFSRSAVMPALENVSKVVVDAEVWIPDGLVVGEDPVLDAKRFRRTENGVTLITQPMIDKLGL